MLARETINTDITPLTAHDSVGSAAELLNKLEVNYLPVVDPASGKLIGQVSKDMLDERDDPSSVIGAVDLSEAVKIYEHQHIFEAARLMLLHEMRFLPVVDDDWIFKGIIRKQEVLELLTSMLNLSEYGSVLTIELSRQDFTLSEIVHLIEMEGAKILGITVETPGKHKEVYEVSIKLNLQEVSRIAAALRRYGYDLLTEQGSETLGVDIETRADALIKYLDM